MTGQQFAGTMATFSPLLNALTLKILDRVGGGDGFAAGLIYGLMEFSDPQKAVEYGAAHGALTMTTPGDNSMVSLSEIENLINGDLSRIER